MGGEGGCLREVFGGGRRGVFEGGVWGGRGVFEGGVWGGGRGCLREVFGGGGV